jgi:hypothetical protein
LKDREFNYGKWAVKGQNDRFVIEGRKLKMGKGGEFTGHVKVA